MKNTLFINSNTPTLPFTTKHTINVNKVWWKKRATLTLINIFAKLYTISNFLLLAVGSTYISYKTQSLIWFFFFCLLETFSLFNLIWNWIHFTLAESCIGTIAEEKYCSFCETQVPLNSKHCPLCSVCVIEKDHHCFFLGKCVDKFNQRYFVNFCYHASWSCFIAHYYFVTFTNANYKYIFSKEFIYYFVPFSFVKYIIGDVSIVEFLFIFGCSISFSTSLFTFLMYMLQVRCKIKSVSDLVKELKMFLYEIIYFICKFPATCKAVIFYYVLRIKYA